MIDATTLVVMGDLWSAGRRSAVPDTGRLPQREPRCSPTSTCCRYVYYAADDTLPKRPANEGRRITDAEIVTLMIAQAVLDIPSDRVSLRAAARQLPGLFPQ